MKKFKFLKRNKISRLPKAPGVYAFKNEKEILYIGKASRIRERVKNHFWQPNFKETIFLKKIGEIGYIQTDSEIEALILEANLIKKYQPKYNVLWKDDKNYFFVGITKDYNPPTTLPSKGRAPNFPRIFITHQTKFKVQSLKFKVEYVGPFVEGKALKQTLKVLRKVFPYRSCKNLPKRSCLWYHLGRCPAPCLLALKIMKKECQKNAENIFKILQGKKNQVLKNLKKEMKKMSKLQDFEKAAKIRDQILALERIFAHAKIFISGVAVESRPWQFVHDNWKEWEKELKKILLTKKKISKIEAYDVSNIQGQLATGAMVTFVKGKPEKNFYRRFKIKISGKPNDIAMIREVLNRRFKHPEWDFPDLILIDGGRAQLNVAIKVLNQYKSVKSASIRVLALAKKKNELFIGGEKKPILLRNLPREIFNLILQLRDEAHRFAISYHKKLREKELLG